MTISGIEKIRKILRYVNLFSYTFQESLCKQSMGVKVFSLNPEFRILMLTFHRKSASKC